MGDTDNVDSSIDVAKIIGERDVDSEDDGDGENVDDDGGSDDDDGDDNGSDDDDDDDNGSDDDDDGGSDDDGDGGVGCLFTIVVTVKAALSPKQPL